jgi:hypothetical protein
MNLDDYLTAAEAAQLLNKTVSLVGRLCRAGKILGAEKKGSAAWLLPRESVLSYKPMKRGVKPGTQSKKARLAAEKAAILDAVAKGANQDEHS